MKKNLSQNLSRNKPTRPKQIGNKSKEIMFSEVKINQVFLFKDKKDRKPLNAKVFIKDGLYSYIDGQVLIILKREDITKKVIINI